MTLDTGRHTGCPGSHGKAEAKLVLDRGISSAKNACLKCNRKDAGGHCWYSLARAGDEDKAFCPGSPAHLGPPGSGWSATLARSTSERQPNVWAETENSEVRLDSNCSNAP